MARKLKGQNTSVNVVSATTGLREEFTDVKECTITFDREVQSESYLGQTTDQKSSDFQGISFSFTAHSRKAKILDLIDLINNITRGLAADSIQIVTTLRFPDGNRRIVISNAEFGNLEVGISSKADFVTFPFEGSADDYTILPA